MKNFVEEKNSSHISSMSFLEGGRRDFKNCVSFHFVFIPYFLHFLLTAYISFIYCLLEDKFLLNVRKLWKQE